MPFPISMNSTLLPRIDYMTCILPVRLASGCGFNCGKPNDVQPMECARVSPPFATLKKSIIIIIFIISIANHHITVTIVLDCGELDNGYFSSFRGFRNWSFFGFFYGT